MKWLTGAGATRAVDLVLGVQVFERRRHGSGAQSERSAQQPGLLLVLRNDVDVARKVVTAVLNAVPAGLCNGNELGGLHPGPDGSKPPASPGKLVPLVPEVRRRGGSENAGRRKARGRVAFSTFCSRQSNEPMTLKPCFASEPNPAARRDALDLAGARLLRHLILGGHLDALVVAAQDEVDHAADRVGAVDRGGAVAQDFDAVEIAASGMAFKSTAAASNG